MLCMYGDGMTSGDFPIIFSLTQGTRRRRKRRKICAHRPVCEPRRSPGRVKLLAVQSLFPPDAPSYSSVIMMNLYFMTTNTFIIYFFLRLHCDFTGVNTRVHMKNTCLHNRWRDEMDETHLVKSKVKHKDSLYMYALVSVKCPSVE